MEKLFAIDQDPLIRVRIGNARRKLNRQGEAIREYVRAADLFAEKGFVVKALAQYNLALRLDSSNEDVRSKMEKMEMFRDSKMVTRLKNESMEYRPPQPFGSVVPHYSSAKKHDKSVPETGPIDTAVAYDAHVSASFF